MKKRKSSAIHPAGCPNGPHQMAIIDPQLFGPVDDCVLLQASGDGMRNAGIERQESSWESSLKLYSSSEPSAHFTSICSSLRDPIGYSQMCPETIISFPQEVHSWEKENSYMISSPICRS